MVDAEDVLRKVKALARLIDSSAVLSASRPLTDALDEVKQAAYELAHRQPFHGLWDEEHGGEG